MLGPEWRWWNYTLLLVAVSGLTWIWWPKLVAWFSSNAERLESPSVASKIPGKTEKVVLFFWLIRDIGMGVHLTNRPKHYGFMYREILMADNVYYEIRPSFRAIFLPFWIIARSIYVSFLVFLFIVPFAVMALVIDAIFDLGLLDYLGTL